MGTAVRSGDNRAVEAAEAAMASPLLDAGAIDGARGILINITGSSSLKLSEVNEASTLIQTSAHEDANIIFGAVLDERMGDEVKITVIATGFRDQMPERRARMLNVEEAPVVSVPVVAPDGWMREAAQAAAVSSAPRFMSEDDDRDGSDEPAFVTVAPSSTGRRSRVIEEQEPVMAQGRPRFAELAEPRFAEHAESPASSSAASIASRPQIRESIEIEEEESGSMVSASDEWSAGPSTHVAEPPVDAERDLDVPAFMRRLQF
jgi:cell division protein FtsZ